jgi:uncharacterized protein YegP (UPF0339 family)
MRFEIFKSNTNNQWYFRLINFDKKAIAKSEGYNNKEDCINTVCAIRNFMYKFYIPMDEVKE